MLGVERRWSFDILMTPQKTLVLSRNYPNNVTSLLGLWTERFVRHISASCAVRVVAPVPYCPPLPGIPADYKRFRRVQPQRQDGGVIIYHPRFLVGPGYSLYNFEALLYYLSIRKLVDRIRREFRFELIHAHFSYPDGVVGAWLGKRYEVPVVVTEHACWQPWMDQYPLVCRQAVRASRKISFHIAVSEHVRSTIAHFTGSLERIRVIPVGVDGAVFSPAAPQPEFDPNQILYVGFINQNKGIDVLLKAMCRLRKHRPDLSLVLVGGSFYRNSHRQREEVVELAGKLELTDHVTFVGPKKPKEVARYMQQSSLLVLPSRRESFGAVLVEALACGTPVVATRCGGPQDIVTDQVGVLVSPEDVDALARGIEHVLGNRSAYNADKLRNYALQRFSWGRVANDTVDVYREALEIRGGNHRKTFDKEISESTRAGY